VREIAFRSDTTAGDRDVTANIIQIFLDGQISANNGTATDKPNIPLIGAAEIQPDVVKCAEFKCISAAFVGLRTQLADLEVVDLVLSVTQTSRAVRVASLLPSSGRRL
jgi:hypothetical protein